MRIISVDDERWSSNLIQLMIEKLKAENPEYKNVEFVASFTGALEALEYLQSHKIDLIFLDVEMPEMTGLEFAAKVEEYYLTAKSFLLRRIANMHWMRGGQRQLIIF